MVTSFYHGEKNHYGFFTQVSNLILQSTDTKELIPDYNYSIAYAESGFLLPCVVKSYSVIDAVMLFYDFPQDISHSVSATLRIESAAGIIRKRVKLFEYKDTFQRQEMEEVDKSYNSFHEEYKQ